MVNKKTRKKVYIYLEVFDYNLIFVHFPFSYFMFYLNTLDDYSLTVVLIHHIYEC